MVNMAVPYSRPDRASLTLWNEVAERFGARAQNKGFVTGYKAAGNVTSHNADANGVTHAVDLGVDIEGDGTGIPVAEAEGVALAIIRSGKAKYVIYNRRIASANTGWEWWPYNGASPHLDHIHVSTAWDFYWGDPCPTPASETDSTAAWGVLGGVSPAGGGTITPIEEDDIMASIEDLANVIKSDDVRRALYEAIWFGVPGAPLIQNHRLNRGEWPQTLLGANERRVAMEILPAALGAIKADGDVDPKAIADAVFAAFGKDVAKVVAENLKVVANG